MNQSLHSFISDEIVIDLRTTCSKDEAAAKLLGWLRGPIYPKYIQVTTSEIQKRKNEELKPDIAIPYKNPHGDRPFSPEPNPAALDSVHDPLPYRIDEAQLKSLHSLDCTLSGSLEAQLLELHGAALLDFGDAVVEPDLEIKANAVLYWEKQIRQAAKYLRDIDDELSNGDDSKLKVDKKASKNAGTPQLRLSSLDLWARKKYQISIFENDDSEVVDNEAEEDSTEDELKSIAANNLYATLALLCEEYAMKNTGYLKKNGDINITALSQHIEQLGKDKTKTEKNLSGDTIQGLRVGVISDRLKVAFKRLKEKLD